ncbi:MAG: hypothetical protein ABSH51_19665 [Solirubrobacteraceae bacterium]|jgi:hypothetical protein
MNARPAIRLGVTLTALALPSVVATSSAGAAALKGDFGIGSGSYFRMGEPNGSFFSNPYSADSNKSYTLIAPGSDGGLRTGVVEKAPSPAFDAKGDSLAGLIIKPTNFTGIRFGLATTSAPAISVSGDRLSGQVNGLVAEWNKQVFKQGNKVTGTYDATTHHYVLTWSALIKGGPFNGFTGYWRLQGTFSPA